jgi:hypothetical protein
MGEASKAVTTKNQGQVVELRSPYSLIESAVASGAPIDTLEKLMLLQERHEKNEARKQFYTAMQMFQGLKPELKRSSNVNFNTQKGTTNYNFCALPDIEKALKGPLSECGLSYRFSNYSEGDMIGIRCIVSHVAGHSESTEMKAPVDNSGNKNAIQGIGSTSTYLMRYTLIAAFGLTTADEDNDGKDNSDLPLLTLLRHNEVVRDNMQVILCIKQAMAENDYEEVAMYLDGMQEDVRNALWVAPTKGGIFTTAERAAMKSNEFNAAREAYFAKKNAEADKGAAQ